MNIFKLSSSEVEAVVMSASPTRLIVMTYDAAILSLEKAISMIDAGDIEGRYFAVERATDLIAELYMTLDHEKGGEIAQNLGCLYGFLLSRLPRINFYNDKQTASDSIAILQRLRDSWDLLDNVVSSEADATGEMVPAASSETATAAAY